MVVFFPVTSLTLVSLFFSVFFPLSTPLLSLALLHGRLWPPPFTLLGVPLSMSLAVLLFPPCSLLVLLLGKRPRRSCALPIFLIEHLILDILSGLPTAVLSWFKRVCKDWRRRLIPMILGPRPNLALIHLRGSEPRLLCFSHDGRVRQDLCSHSLFDMYQYPT